MAVGVKDMALLPVDEPVTKAIDKPQPDVVSQIVALASDPGMDVAKLEKLIEMQERVMRSQAKAAFDAAFSDMQGELPTITERGEILVNGALRSKYARYEDIIEIIRPILKAHGFAIRHRNETNGGVQTIVGILSHRAGHREEDRFECQPDTSGGKQPIQAIGSTRSYGQRYTTISLTGIVTKGQDDDGSSASAKTEPALDMPAGFQDWWDDIRATADEGLPALKSAWEKSLPAFRSFVTKTNLPAWESLKVKAANVTKNGGVKS